MANNPTDFLKEMLSEPVFWKFLGLGFLGFFLGMLLGKAQ